MANETTMLHFRVDGEGLTNLIRQTWAEGRLSIALNLCEDSGCPPQYHIDLCTGNLKIVGVGELSLESDDTIECCGIDITLDATIKRLEKLYVKLH